MTEFDFSLSNTGELSQRLRSMGMADFSEAAEYVRLLPYARVKGTSVVAVLDEGKGTCSSKHAFLATVALEAGRADVELTLGVYEMNERNTPGVGEILAGHSLAYVPEAHCYLRVNGKRFDFTGIPCGVESPFQTLLTESRIDPATLNENKPRYHREFIRRWSEEHALDANHVWQVREECIKQLSQKLVSTMHFIP